MSDPREKLTLPDGHDKLLLHSCCAPCSGETMEAMLASGIDFTIFFYNPNIHPQKEYDLRKDENIRFAQKHGVPFIDADYDTDNWFARAKGLENEPERGARCTACFDMRFERTALYAYEHGFKVITSSLGHFALEEHGRRSTTAASGRPRATRTWSIGTTTGARKADRRA